MRSAYFKNTLFSLLLFLPLLISVIFFIYDIDFTWPVVAYFFHFSLLYICFIPLIWVWTKRKETLFIIVGSLVMIGVMVTFLFGLILSYLSGSTKLFEKQLSQQTYVAIYLNGDQGALGGEELVACLIKKPFPGIEQTITCNFENSFYTKDNQTFVQLNTTIIDIPDKTLLYQLAE